MQTSPHSVLRDVDDRRNLPITQPSNWPSTFPARWSEGRAAILRADHRLWADPEYGRVQRRCRIWFRQRLTTIRYSHVVNELTGPAQSTPSVPRDVLRVVPRPTALRNPSMIPAAEA